MKPANRRHSLLPVLALCSGFLAVVCAADEASEALVFEEQLDGKCQILSDGGKLVVLRNLNPEQGIRYRLVRMFVDIPQGRIDGVILPGEPPQKLGCNRVNKRRQHWRVERATFIAPGDEGDR